MPVAVAAALATQPQVASTVEIAEANADTDTQAHGIADIIAHMIDHTDAVFDTTTHPQGGFISTSKEPTSIKPQKDL